MSVGVLPKANFPMNKWFRTNAAKALCDAVTAEDVIAFMLEKAALVGASSVNGTEEFSSAAQPSRLPRRVRRCRSDGSASTKVLSDGTQMLLPASDEKPGAHGLQVDLLLAPEVAEDVFAAHGVQDVDAGSSE